MKIMPNSGKIIPIAPKGDVDAKLKAIIVQKTPKTIAKIEPIKDIPDGPRPGFILFISLIPPFKISKPAVSVKAHKIFNL